MIDDVYEGHEAMEISRDPVEYIDDDAFSNDDGDDTVHPVALIQDRNGVAWREIEKYRERKALEIFLKDDLYDELDFNRLLD